MTHRSIKSFSRRMPSVGILLALLQCWPNQARAADAPDLDRPIAAYAETRQKRGFDNVCDSLLKIPCGREIYPTTGRGPAKEQALLELKNTTARKVLDALAERTPNTQWQLRDGVLNVEPKERDREDILSKKVALVSARGVSSVQAALDVFDDAGIPISYQEMGRVRLFGTINLELKDVSVRDALNAIVKADGHLTWLFAHSSSPESKSKGTLTFFSSRKEGGAKSSDELKKTKRWKREHGGKKPNK